MKVIFFGALALSSIVAPGSRAAEITLTNATWTPTGGLYADINKAFTVRYKAETGDTVTVTQSSGGCTKQACAVRDGEQRADVVSLAIATDVDALHDPAALLPADWRAKFPNHASAFSSPVVFLVRKDNPKTLLDWPDLVKPGVAVLVIDAKASHSARWFYLAARGAATRLAGGDDAKGRDFVGAIYRNAPEIADRVGGAIEKFATKGTGDAIVVSESEALAAVQKFGADRIRIVRPSVTILEELPVAVVEKTAASHGAKAAAEAYVRFLFSPEAGELIAKNHYRPADPAALARHAADLPPVKTFTIDEAFGGWAKANARFFADGGEYDTFLKARR